MDTPDASIASRRAERGTWTDALPFAAFFGALPYVATALLGASAFLFVPRAGPSEDLAPPARVVLVDASASVRRVRPDWLPWVRGALADQARIALERGESFAVVSFASEVGLSHALGTPEAFLEALRGRDGAPFDPRTAAGGDGASRLAAAVEVGAGLCLAPGRATGTLVLLGSDGGSLREPIGPLAEVLAAGGTVDALALPPPELDDVGVLRVRVPQSIEAGAPLLAVIEVAYAPGRARARVARLRVETKSAGHVTTRDVEVALPPAGGTVDVPVSCGEADFGRIEVHASVSLDGRIDPIPENDRASAATLADGELVLLVAAAPGRLDAARDWLTPSGTSALVGLQFVFVEPSDVAARLREADALVTFDVAPRDLPELAVDAFVRRGGGWLATSGDYWLDDWVPGHATGGLHGILPLEPAPLEHGPRDIVLLVDGSGSMDGEPFDTVRTACLDLVSAALPTDEVSLRFFTAGLREASVLKPRTASADEDLERAADAARRLVRLHVPSGNTHILASLESFAAERRGVQRESLVFLLTDGRENEGYDGVAERAARVVSELVRSRAAVRPIAIGANADLAFLERLARPGEDVFVPANLDDLRSIFRREISGAQCRDGEALEVRRSVAESGSIAADLRGAEPLDVPSVRRFVKNVARPGAEVVWQADEGEPVLAARRVALGRTALLSTLPLDGWAPAWTRRLGWGEPALFGNLLRWLARGQRGAEQGPTLTVEDDWCVLEGLDASWPPLVEADLLDGANRAAEVLAALEFLPPSREAVDPTPRREARLPFRADERDGLFVRVRAPSGSSDPAPPDWILPLDDRRPREFRASVPGVEALLGAARAVSAPFAASGAPPRTARAAAAHPSAPWILGLGLGLWFLAAARWGVQAFRGGDR